MKSIFPLLAALLLSSTAILGQAAANTSQAEDNLPADEATTTAIVDKFATLVPNAKANITAVTTTEIPGLYAVEFRGGQVMYSGPKGEFVVDGTLYQVTEKGAVDLRKARLKPLRAEELAAIDKEQMVIFAPEGESKAVVYAFTDVDCGYCRKMHQEMADYNAAGIEIRYLAFPRAGVDSSSYQKMVSIWCADEPLEAMTKAKAGRSIASAQCENPVAEQLSLGGRLGVTGTPSLVTEEGDMLPGYLPAPRLVKALGL